MRTPQSSVLNRKSLIKDMSDKTHLLYKAKKLSSILMQCEKNHKMS